MLRREGLVVCGVPTGRGILVWGLPGVSPQAGICCPLWGKDGGCLFGDGGEPRTGFCVIVLGTGGAASGSRDPRLLTGRPYGMGRVRRGGGGTEVPQGNDCRGVGAGV